MAKEEEPKQSEETKLEANIENLKSEVSLESEVHTYKDSSTFLKASCYLILIRLKVINLIYHHNLQGTQSANPHNDYCQHFVDVGQRPQNFIRDVGLADRFEEYPKLKELIRLKDDLIAKTATPPMYLKCDVKTFDLRELNSQFDVILVEPPLEEYQRSQGVTNMQFWSWEDVSYILK